MTRATSHHQLQVAAGLPAAALAGWTAMLADGMHVWQRMIDAQIAVLRQQEAFLRSHNHVARGADWTDHYGRRTHDVNVERL